MFSCALLLSKQFENSTQISCVHQQYQKQQLSLKLNVYPNLDERSCDISISAQCV